MNISTASTTSTTPTSRGADRAFLLLRTLFTIALAVLALDRHKAAA